MALIKAGTYKFKDDLTDFGSTLRVTINIPFTTKPNFEFNLNNYSIVYIEGGMAFSSMEFFLGGEDSYTKLSVSYIGNPSVGELDVYETYNVAEEPDTKWDTCYTYLSEFATNTEGLKGFGQIVTITEDFIPSNNDEEAFATWFNDNVEPQEEPIPTSFVCKYTGRWKIVEAYKYIDNKWVQISKADDSRIIDLSQTEWKFNNNIDVQSPSSDKNVFYIRFMIWNTEHQILNCNYFNFSNNQVSFNTTAYPKFYFDGTTSKWYYQESNTTPVIETEAPSVIIQQGGTDSTNSSLIAWMLSYAQLQ